MACNNNNYYMLLMLMLCGYVWGEMYDDGEQMGWWMHRKMMMHEDSYYSGKRKLAQVETNVTDSGQCLMKVAYKATYIQGNNAYYLSQFVLGDVSNSVCVVECFGWDIMLLYSNMFCVCRLYII
jgi:hypothetical protein